jgi:RNA-directed DNA polymerase
MSVYSFRAVYNGYRACRRRKRGTANAQRYELGLLDHLVDTASALQDRTYAPSRSLCFVARQPKAREIHAADFRDRVVHHVLVPRLEALFEPVFIHDLYSNRVGKGTHAAVERLGSFMRAVSDNGNRPAWFLQLDIRNFFNSIDQALLFRFINRRLKKVVDGGVITSAEAWDLSWLTRVLLKQDLKAETVYRCTPRELAQVPEHKRLTAAPPGRGLPIGNLTSQFFANVYLNALDQFVKHHLRCRQYLRYVDDFVLLHPDREQLRDWERQIEVFLGKELMLALKPERQLRPVRDGADFLGYIVRPHYRLVRRRVVGNLRERLVAFERAQVTASSLRLPADARDQLRSLLASYLGHFAHADAHRLVQRLFEERPWLGVLFAVRGGNAAAGRQAEARHAQASPRIPGTHPGQPEAPARGLQSAGVWKLRPRWEPPAVTSLRSQVAYFREAFQPALVLVQLGNRVALFQDDLAAALMAAPWIARWSQTRAETRNGLGDGRSWPLSHLKGLGRSLRNAGKPYVFVAEEGLLRGGMKRRVLRYLCVGRGPLLTADGADSPSPLT